MCPSLSFSFISTWYCLILFLSSDSTSGSCMIVFFLRYSVLSHSRVIFPSLKPHTADLTTYLILWLAHVVYEPKRCDSIPLTIADWVKVRIRIRVSYIRLIHRNTQSNRQPYLMWNKR